MSKKTGGVHRGKLDTGGSLNFLSQALQEYGLHGGDLDLQLEGGMASGPRGSRQMDIDLSAMTPQGLSQQELAELEIRIQNETGIDFYFRRK